MELRYEGRSALEPYRRLRADPPEGDEAISNAMSGPASSARRTTCSISCSRSRRLPSATCMGNAPFSRSIDEKTRTRAWPLFIETAGAHAVRSRCDN